MIVTLKPDLVFLDIVIPEISGFDMLESLGFYDFEVILFPVMMVTAFGLSNVLRWII